MQPEVRARRLRQTPEAQRGPLDQLRVAALVKRQVALQRIAARAGAQRALERGREVRQQGFAQRAAVGARALRGELVSLVQAEAPRGCRPALRAGELAQRIEPG